MNDATAGPRDPFVAAWIATVVDVPLYTLIGGACAYVGAQVWETLTGVEGEARVGVDDTEAAVLTVTALIIAVGIAAVAHTIGRRLHSRTAGSSPARASAAFALMGGTLGLIPAGMVAAGSDEPAALAFVAIAIVLPCASVAALTRLLLPRVAASETVVTGFAIAAVLCVLVACALLAMVWVTWPDVDRAL
ncbi:hypothetical protein [Demequina subtropica]|uniref:hypothetical protein n=1 Tax=Demequina subtropica TaxID=1638989 RepID=UPI000781C710|nr:hypothetical protein [Demequina subtropica]